MTPLSQTIQSIYQALEQGKLVKVIALLQDKIVVQQASSLPYGGIFYGREGFITSFSLILSTWELYRKVPNLFLADEQNVAVFGEVHLKGKRRGDILVTPFVDHWTLQKGEVSEMRMFDWDTAKLLNYLNEADDKTEINTQ